MSFLSLQHTRYHLAIAGQGSPLLLLHGFAGSIQNWDSLIATLQANFRVIAIDILGHGLSDKPPDVERYRIERVAEDMATLLLKLGNHPVHLLGYSMGGRLALYLAVHYPELIQSLVLESSSPGILSPAERENRTQQDAHLASEILQNGIEWFVEYWEQIALFASQKALPTEAYLAQRQQRLHNDPLGLANSLLGMGTGQQPPLWGALPQLVFPTLLIAGQLDSKYIQINQSMAEYLPNVETHFVENAGHNVHLEDSAQFLKAINHFWNLL